MVEIELHWMGLLSNADSTILGLKLPQGFEIKYFTKDEAFRHLKDVGEVNDFMDFVKLCSDFYCINMDENRLYYLTRTETINSDFIKEGYLGSVPFGESDQLFNEIIKKLFRLLRMFKEGDIRIPMNYTYYEYQGKNKLHVTMYTTLYISPIKYHFLEEDFKKLNDFFNIQLPLTPNFLELAFQSYEIAYETQNKALAFLALMMSLEILFNPGKSELRYRIARNCAVLLGNTKKESDDIFKNVCKIYDIRSNIIHSGNVRECSDTTVAQARNYVREAIKKMIQFGESKNVILSKLNSLGFGEINMYESG